MISNTAINIVFINVIIKSGEEWMEIYYYNEYVYSHSNTLLVNLTIVMLTFLFVNS